MYDAIFLKLPRLDIVFFNGSILKVIQCYVWVAREGRPNFFCGWVVPFTSASDYCVASQSQMLYLCKRI